MDKLKGQKKVIKASISKLKNGLESVEFGKDSAEISLFDSRVSELETKLDDVFDKIFDTCKEDEFDAYLSESLEIRDILDKYKLTIFRARDKLNLNLQSSNRISDSTEKTKGDPINVKLPEFHIPSFAGISNLEWLSFSDLFMASVGQNSKISDAQKLQYLTGALKGDALRVIQALPITNANFEIAWSLLKERYSNKRELVFALIKRLTSLNTLNSENASQLLNIVDTSKEVVRSLRSLDIELSGFSDTIFVYLITQRLDPSTKSWWERDLKDDSIPKFEDLLGFLTHHCRTLQQSTTPKPNYSRKPTTKVSSFVAQVKGQCVYCKSSHAVHQCHDFKALPVQGRHEFVKNNSLCFNCLASHRVSTCNNRYRCRVCSKKHHSLLHFNKEKVNSNLSPNAREFLPKPNVESVPQTEVVTNISSCVSETGAPKQVLLCTAIIKVTDSAGKSQLVRALLDPGSQASFITEACCNRLGLSKKRAKVQISCLGSADTHTNGLTTIKFTPHFKPLPVFQTNVYIIPKIIGQLPHCNLPSSVIEPFCDLTLADTEFFQSSPIDILLGVSVSLPMLRGDMLTYGDNNPFAVRSDLGWIISGNVDLDKNNPTTLHVNNIRVETDDLVSRFWSLDSVPVATSLSKEELECEEHFSSNCSRTSSGRYMVKLPCHTSPTMLGDSKQLALNRFKSLERVLNGRPEVYIRYKAFMDEYISLGHMEKVPPADLCMKPTYYLPHHAVFKETSTTTKLRVVFDASAKSSSGLSLNNILYTGPRVQQELFPILLRFRTFRVAISADAEKMFRQILVHPSDVNLQRILWRDSPDKPIDTFRLLTVSYGTSAASFLSTRVMRQLALDEEENYPLASKKSLTDFYVDDLLSGTSSEEEATTLIGQITQMMERGGFRLHKWCSNFPSVLRNIPKESKAMDQSLTIDDNNSIKVLGISWHPSTDLFKFSISCCNLSVLTKRKILSEIASVFDPLGWLAPTVIFAKIFLQELWSIKLGWDEEIPESVSSKWINFRSQLPLLDKFSIPRFILSVQPIDIQVHAFCDASEKAYCAVLYIRSVTADNNINVSLLTSKTRVAPVKTISLPRLELCSALLLANLLEVVLPCLNIPIDKTFAWSDSSVTLAWIASEPRRWLPFIANRVSKIQEAAPDVEWNHVPGVDNPADCATRGLLPSEFLECKLWTSGPNFLHQLSLPLLAEQSSQAFEFNNLHLKEQRKVIVTAVSRFQPDPAIFKFSSFTKLCRVFAWCLRFVNNCTKPTERNLSYLSTGELSRAIIYIVKLVQQEEFGAELVLLKSGNPVKSSSKISSLCPFLDSDGVMRVGGRLRNASISPDSKHPMIIPKHHHLTSLIIHHFHVTHLHAAPQLLLSVIRQKYWIPCGRDVVRQFVKKCTICFRLSASSLNQLMGDLPASRVTPSRAFSVCGVDFAGPFLAKERNGRGKKSFKIYISIFVCFASRAIHLEVVSDLTTQSFIGSLKRFIARRGKPSEMLSDCGTNFVGADRELKSVLKSLLSAQGDPNVPNFCASEGINWRFNPPASPHHGGLWEAGVKSMKYHLRRTMGSTLLTLEELFTLTAQIEACLNSRPLCPLSSDPNDLSPLTPGHFLIGSALTSIPELDVSSIPLSRLGRWQLVQRLLQQFWNRWNKEVLSRLQQRPKWCISRPNLAVGELVLIKNELMPPLKWKLGRVLAVHPGKDDKVRVATLKTDSGQLTRPITKLCRLPLD